MIAAHGGGHGLGFPWLAPIRNSCELRGLCCRSCFGPRTCGRGITNSSKRFGALHQGFPFSLLQCRQCRTRMGGCNAGGKGLVFNDSAHRGALDRFNSVYYSGESFHAYTRFIRWAISTVYYKCFLRTRARTHMPAHAHAHRPAHAHWQLVRADRAF